MAMDSVQDGSKMQDQGLMQERVLGHVLTDKPGDTLLAPTPPHSDPSSRATQPDSGSPCFFLPPWEPDFHPRSEVNLLYKF